MVAPDDPRLEECGYARLVGDGLEYYVRKMEVVLGRASKSGQTDVILGDNMNISRQHAKIVFNFTTKEYELIVMGKNGVTVGSTLYTPSSAPCPLKSKDLLAVGDKVFYFLLPKPLDKITKRDLQTMAAMGASKKARTNAQPPAAAVQQAPPAAPAATLVAPPAPAPAAALAPPPAPVPAPMAAFVSQPQLQPQEQVHMMQAPPM